MLRVKKEKEVHTAPLLPPGVYAPDATPCRGLTEQQAQKIASEIQSYYKDFKDQSLKEAPRKIYVCVAAERREMEEPVKKAVAAFCAKHLGSFELKEVKCLFVPSYTKALPIGTDEIELAAESRLTNLAYQYKKESTFEKGGYPDTKDLVIHIAISSGIVKIQNCDTVWDGRREHFEDDQNLFIMATKINCLFHRFLDYYSNVPNQTWRSAAWSEGAPIPNQILDFYEGWENHTDTDPHSRCAVEDNDTWREKVVGKSRDRILEETLRNALGLPIET